MLKAPRFSIIPAGAVTDRSLEPRDLQVLCLLGRHTDRAGWCVRSQVKMSGEISCGRATLQRSLDRLYDAGWVEKKRRDPGAEDAQPSASYAYRVKLDRDDYAFESVTRDAEDTAEESYAETAFEEGGCPPVGTLSDDKIGGAERTEIASRGAQIDGHPGAHPERAPGAHAYAGTKNVPLERTPLERERDARARDRKARFLTNFEARWPTAAADDRQRTAYASDALTEAEETEALAGIAPFLENLKRIGRKGVPAGWRYLEEKRWQLLEQQKAEGAIGSVSYARDTPEWRALIVLHDVAGCAEGFRKIYRGPDGSVSYRKPMTPQLIALAKAPPAGDWLSLNRQQAGAWEGLLRDMVTIAVRKHLKEGDRAPWPWPPGKEGQIYTNAGPPAAGLSDAELADFK